MERGADQAARAVGITVACTCSYEARDEFGVLPAAIARDLVRSPARGVRTAVRATLLAAHALVIAVPEVSSANAIPGVEALRRQVRRQGIPHWIVGPSTDLSEMLAALQRLEREHSPVQLMVTGPRTTRWAGGERAGWRIVTELALSSDVQRKHRILVVDAYADTVETTCAYLRALGHECQAATSGEGALLAASTFAPDIALLDIGLPDLSGYEVARRLRAAQGTQPIYIAAVTGWSSPEDIADAMAAGMDRHIAKPANVDVLRSVLDDAARMI